MTTLNINNLDPRNSYFLRFTSDARRDMMNGFSYFKTGSMDEAVELEGLCGFSFNVDNMTEAEISRKVAMYASNFSYYAEDAEAVIFRGRFIKNNPNAEGVIFEAEEIEGVVEF